MGRLIVVYLINVSNNNDMLAARVSGVWCSGGIPDSKEQGKRQRWGRGDCLGSPRREPKERTE